MITSSTCVAKSITARVIESFAASGDAHDVQRDEDDDHDRAADDVHGFVRSGSQKIDR